ncbi:hypothetical protein PMAYCL1PPCAC_02105, partial [Pristionchus mayeri]
RSCAFSRGSSEDSKRCINSPACRSSHLTSTNCTAFSRNGQITKTVWRLPLTSPSMTKMTSSRRRTQMDRSQTRSATRKATMRRHTEDSIEYCPPPIP